MPLLVGQRRSIADMVALRHQMRQKAIAGMALVGGVWSGSHCKLHPNILLNPDQTGVPLLLQICRWLHHEFDT